MSVHFNLHERRDEWESSHEDRYSKHVTLTFKDFSGIVSWNLLLVLFLGKIHPSGELGSNPPMTQVHGPARKLSRHTLYLTLSPAVAIADR